MRRLLPALTTLALACAQPRPAPDPLPSAPPDPIPSLRLEVEALLTAQAQATWRSWSTGEPADLAATWRGRERLLAPEARAEVRRALGEAKGEARRALAYLNAFLLGEQLAQASAAATERAAAARAGATFAWDGRQVTVREVFALLAAEPDAGRRSALEGACAAAAPWRSLEQAEVAAVEAGARALGFPGALALAAELRGEPPESLATLAEQTLAATDSVHRELLEDLARRELGLPLSALRARDLPRLFRLAHQPRTFPAGRLLADGQAAFQGLGLPLSSLTGLTIDAEPRTGKSPRPLMLPVEVPGRVLLSVLPSGGAGEARAYLHELGAGAFFARVRAEQLEFRRLGPASVPEAWGCLFGGLTGDPAWLAERTGGSAHGPGQEVRAALAERLHEVRLAAARVAAEVERARDPSRGAEVEARWLERALGHPAETGRAPCGLLLRDPLLRSAEVLRAQLLAAQAAAFLARRAGSPAWWRSAENGAWLQQAWAGGTRSTAAEISSSMEFKALDPAALAASARARLDAAGP